MSRVPSAQRYEFTHDVINLYKEISAQYKPRQDLSRQMKVCRKYMNESRYPYNGTDAFTKDFAEEMISYVQNTKDYVDYECDPSLDD